MFLYILSQAFDVSSKTYVIFSITKSNTSRQGIRLQSLTFSHPNVHVDAEIVFRRPERNVENPYSIFFTLLCETKVYIACSFISTSQSLIGQTIFIAETTAEKAATKRNKNVLRGEVKSFFVNNFYLFFIIFFF